MISQQCFSKEWILGFRQKPEYARINPAVLEKMIFALHLVELLATSKLEFIFKGGTSLILLLQNFRRFSTDIDIITPLSKNDVESALDYIVEKGCFTGWTLDENRSYKPGIPKAHYELSFSSGFNLISSQIILDVVFQQNLYPVIEKVPIDSPWTKSKDPAKITIPNIESVLGDKLAAFAPGTTGIRYNTGKSLEMVKQLFDIGELFVHAHDLSILRRSFYNFAKQEILYRNLDLEPFDVLSDILETAKIITLRERNKSEPQKSRFTEIQHGIKAMDSFLVQGQFNIEHAITAAAKAALLSVLIGRKELNDIPKFDSNITDLDDISDLEWNFLNRLKKLPDKSAFFYWKKVVKMLKHPQIF